MPGNFRQLHRRGLDMADSANVAVVRRFYENLSSPDVLMEVLSPTIRWEITPGFPYGGDYDGVEAVFRDFFGGVLSIFDDWRTTMNEVHDAGDRVLALGTYSGRAKTTGKMFTARFSHSWTVDAGTLVRLQQCADTVQLSRALEA
jgi:ketosteroid isomerase-like protein